VIRLSYSRNTNRPGALIADMTGTEPRLPVTRCLGVWPRTAQVLPSRAVRERLASSSHYSIARYPLIAERICGSVVRGHSCRAAGSASKYSRVGFW
jgi:hypothetical protein